MANADNSSDHDEDWKTKLSSNSKLESSFVIIK